MPKAVPKITTVCETCGTSFERTPAFHRSAEAKGGKVRFCSSKCFGIAKSTGLVAVGTAQDPDRPFARSQLAQQFAFAQQCHSVGRATGHR